MFRRHVHPWQKSFVYAFRGLRRVFLRERNFRFHCGISLFVIGMGVVFRVNCMEWAVLFLTISLVLGLEIVNTVIEELCDRISPERQPFIRRIKDSMAGAVLVAS
ncbi:MAG: diacylglycerol kinase family protein, partial [Brevinematales bacterium]